MVHFNLSSRKGDKYVIFHIERYMLETFDRLLIGSLFMSRIVKFLNFIYSLLDSIEDKWNWLLLSINFDVQNHHQDSN